MTRVILTSLLALVLTFHAQADTGRRGQANAAQPSSSALSAGAATPLGQPEATKQPAALVTQPVFEPGSLRLLNGRRVLVLGLRYSADQQKIEIQDSLQPGRTLFLPLSSLRGFDLGAEDQLPAPAAVPIGPVGPAGPRRFRASLVQGSRWSTRPQIVEILTCTEAGALVLAVLPTSATGSQQAIVGSGPSRTEPMRPLELTRTAVLNLFGNRAPQVYAFAMTYDLHFEQAADVARMCDYFNRLAVVQE